MARMGLSAVCIILALSAALLGCSADGPITTESTAAFTSTSDETTERASTTTTVSASPAMDALIPLDYEQDFSALAYSGTWIYSEASGASKLGFVYADEKGASVTFRFVGSHCAWLAKTSDKYGKAKVTVDGDTATTVDLYSETTTWRHVVWEVSDLAFGTHTVSIAWTGKKHTAAKGTNINLDVIQVTGALLSRYQQNDKNVEYSGAWRTNETEVASGGSYALSHTSGAGVSVTFTGVQLDWYAKTGPPYGRAWVTVDGGDPTTVDLYSDEEAWKQLVWSSGCLEMGSHVVTIEWSGEADPKAEDTYINVDCFEVAGLLD